MLAGSLVLAGIYLLVFGGIVQYCSVCDAPYCIANTGAIISCSPTQYLVSVFQTVSSSEPFAVHWNYTLNVLGLLVLISGVFVYARTKRTFRHNSSSDKTINREFVQMAVITAWYLIASRLDAAPP